jgi:hypothetical protein
VLTSRFIALNQFGRQQARIAEPAVARAITGAAQTISEFTYRRTPLAALWFQ